MLREMIRPWLCAVGVFFVVDFLISVLAGVHNPLWFLLCPLLAAAAADWAHARHGSPLNHRHILAVLGAPAALAIIQSVMAAFSGIFPGAPWAYGVSALISVAAAAAGFALNAFARITLLDFSAESSGYAAELDRPRAPLTAPR